MRRALAVALLAGLAGCGSPSGGRFDVSPHHPRANDAILRVRTARHVVALSFDDGPSPRFTPPVLRALVRARAHATFFLVGRAARAAPGLVREERHLGMEIGNHTLDHPRLVGLAPAALRREIDGGATAIHRAGGGVPRLFRPPYGFFGAPVEAAAARARERIAGWDVPLERFIDRYGVRRGALAAAAQVRPGSIIAAHDGRLDRSRTVAALPVLLTALHRRGFSVVSVSALLGGGGALPVDPGRSPAGRASPGGGFWPSFGHDGAHTGSAPVTGPQTGRVRWRRRLEGPVVPGPAVARGGVVLAASNGGVLHAIDLRTGRDRWRFSGGEAYGSDLSTVPAVLADGTILWPGPRDSVWVLDRRGRLLRRIPLTGAPLSPLVDERRGRAYLADQSGELTTVRLGSWRASGRVRLGPVSYGSPALGRDGTVYETAGRALVATRGDRIRWRVAARALSEVSPAVAPDGTIVFGANDDTEYGVSPAGRVRWRRPLGALTYSSPAATASGLVLAGDHLGRVDVLTARTGALRGRLLGLGRTPTRRSVGVWTAPVLDRRGDVYFGTRPGHVYGFAADGRRMWDLATGATVDSDPALAADGTLLVGSENGTLYAIADR